MKVIGLVGGVGAGKSTVAKALKGLGAMVIDADAFAHQALKMQEVVLKAWVRWVMEQGRPSAEVMEFAMLPTLDRAAVAKIVFSDPEELKFLEDLVHPHVLNLIESAYDSMTKLDPPAIVFDVPLLFEGGYDGWCDTVWFVECSATTRMERYAVRTGQGVDDVAEQVRLRDNAHWTLDHRRMGSDRIIDNNDGSNATAQVAELWNELFKEDHDARRRHHGPDQGDHRG